MTFSKSDLPHIKWSLVIFVFVLCAGSAAIVASENFSARSQREQRDANNQLSKARNQFATTEQDRENMKAYTLEYGSLLERNIIGDSQRLDWVEGMDNLRKQNLVLDFRYTIAPQKPYTPNPPLDSGNFQLNTSDMTLQFELLHEEQLTAFFDALHTGIKGWFILDHCSLERTATAPRDGKELRASRATPLLKAECTGGWLALNNKDAK